MALMIPFSTPYEAAKAVREHMPDSGTPLHLIPYQPMNADAPWWLSPRSENPAYRYGKIVFTHDLLRSQEFFVALYMEKGIGRSAAPIYGDSERGRRYIMDGPGRIGADWLWPSFLRALTSGEFAAVLSHAEADAGEPLVVTVDASHVTVPARPKDAIDAHSPRFPRDVVTFDCSAGVLTLDGTSYNADLLRPLACATTLQELGLAIQKLPELDSFWMDVAVGLRFRPSPTAAASPPDVMWDASTVLTRGVLPYRAWLR